ncbi:MAG: TetR/AcrR family transcriptional regulator [Clostridiales bacterium]|nr:TetR/AcrR family transcriptional regulator [Clostridiales bacterium]
MGDITYSKKEISVFNGIIALMERGVNPYSIKVSDIAREADIGKGTIYDYFSSKEEAISRAILYYIKDEINIAFSAVKLKDHFKEKFFEMLYIIYRRMDSNISIFRMLLSIGETQDFYEYLSEYKENIQDNLHRSHEINDHLLEAGVKEGVITKGLDPYYQRMVVSSAILGFSQYLGQKCFSPSVSLKEAMEAAYVLLVKALN